MVRLCGRLNNWAHLYLKKENKNYILIVAVYLLDLDLDLWIRLSGR